MIWVGIVGAKGHVGEALTRLVAGHPGAQVSSFINPKDFDGTGMGRFEYQTMFDAIEKSDIIFSGLTGNIPEDILSKALLKGKKIIDVSDEACCDGSIFPGSIYGLSELYRDTIKNASLVSNPSCYCTGAMLGLAPLMSSELIDASSVVIESESGITGLRNTDTLKDAEVVYVGGHKVYKLENSTYSEEIKTQLETVFSKNTAISYISYINGIRGLVTTISANSIFPLKDGEVEELYKRFYNGNPFVKVHGDGGLNEEDNSVNGCLCRIGARTDKNTGKLVITTVMNSIVKGLTGQAVQSMNLMYGFDEKTGLQYAF